MLQYKSLINLGNSAFIIKLYRPSQLKPYFDPSFDSIAHAVNLLLDSSTKQKSYKLPLHHSSPALQKDQPVSELTTTLSVVIFPFERALFELRTG